MTLSYLSLPFLDQGNEIGAESKVSAIGKRTGTYRSWEPIFIGTHSDPLYDERLSWEGRSDKMTHVSDWSTKFYIIYVLSISSADFGGRGVTY